MVLEGAIVTVALILEVRLEHWHVAEDEGVFQMFKHGVWCLNKAMLFKSKNQ